MLAERGHAVEVLEATGEAGGQILLAARNPRRKEMIGIVDWRLSELERLGVPIHYNVFAEGADILERNPDLVVIATGGIAQNPLLDAGDDLVVSSWDIIAGAIKPEGPVLLYDDNGAHTGMTAAEMIAATGAELEIVSPERMFAPEIGGMNHVPYAKVFAEKNVRVTINTRLKSVRREGNQLVAVLGSDYSDKASVERRVAQVGRRARHLADGRALSRAENRLSRNLGAVDYQALINQQNPIQMRNPNGKFDLFPDRRRCGQPQYPCRYLRRAALRGVVLTKTASMEKGATSRQRLNLIIQTIAGQPVITGPA